MGNGASDGSGGGSKKGGGFFFWRKKKVIPAPLDPLRKAGQIMNSVEAKERILSAIKVVVPGTSTRWDKVLGIINRYTEPSEDVPYPLNILIDFNELQEIMKLLFNDVKFISSDGLALLRTYIPKLYDKHNVERCRLLSQKERDDRNLMDECFAYGEIEAEIFATIYLKVVSVYGSNPQGIFYDLGCGVGTLVYTAAFIGTFQKVVGIEFLDSLIVRGEKRTHRWDKFKKDFTPAMQQVNIQWVSSDFVDNPNWTEATFILLHWTAFSLESRKLITKYLGRCAEGTQVITFTTPIDSPDYQLLLTDTCDTSWGKADFFFHEKIGANRVSN